MASSWSRLFLAHSRQRKRSWAFKRPALARMGTPHDAQTPKDGLPRCKQRELRAYLANCFGDYYTRTGLDLKMREILTFSMIASLGGCEPQLGGHVAANLAVGNDRQVLLDTITQLLPFIGYPRTLNAIRVINEGTSTGA